MDNHEDYLKQFLYAIEWKEGYESHSIVLLSFWTLLCLQPVYTLPFWCFFLYHAPSFSVQIPPEFLKRTFLSRLSLCTVAVWAAVWISLAQWLCIRKIIGLSVTLVLVWNQPVLRFTRDVYHKLCTPQPMHSLTAPQTEPLDRYYRFIVIEHQRSWLGRWTTLLLPNERPDWSDEFLQKVPSIHEFHLPPCTIKTNGDNQCIKTHWTWAIDQWHIDYNRNVDKDGWEYGSWDWKSWASTSGLRFFTRRRYWVRHAYLEQQTSAAVLIQPRPEQDNQSSYSLSSFDSIISTPPSLISHLQKKSLPTHPCRYLETSFW